MGRFIAIFLLVFVIGPIIIWTLGNIYSKISDSKKLDQLEKKMLKAKAEPGIERFEFLVKKKSITLDDLAEFRALPEDEKEWHREQARRAGDFGLAMWCGSEFLDKV